MTSPTKRRGFGHGGYRLRRKDQGVELVVLHLEVKAANYEWVDSVRKSLGITKGEALDLILEKDRLRITKRVEKSCINSEIDAAAR